MSLNFNEIINNQPTVNIGCLGSVTDGKSSMVNSICGIKTQRHSSEHIKNITIRGVGIHQNDFPYTLESDDWKQIQMEGLRKGYESRSMR